MNNVVNIAGVRSGIIFINSSILPEVLFASVGLLKRIGYDNGYNILLKKQQDPHRSITFFVYLKQKYNFFHHIFFVFYQSAKRILLFLQLDETPDGVLGARY